MNDKALTMLQGLSPVAGTVLLILVIAGIGKKVWKQGESGQESLKSLLWFSPLIAMAYNLAIVAKIGNNLMTIANNLITMMGFGSLL